MITIQAKVSCDKYGCEEKDDITLALSVKHIHVGEDSHEVPELEVFFSPVGWWIVFSPTSYGDSSRYGSGTKCFCPKHTGV
jgi:hypothetical protein